MIERERQPEKLQEQKEYNAEAGIAKAVSAIERLLKSQEYVVVAISGSSTNVGKSYISANLMRELTRRDISFAPCGDISSFSTKPEFRVRDGSGKGHVLVLSAEYPALNKESKIGQDNYLKKQAEQFGLPISKIDLRIFVYRPDKPFDINTETADILIRNEEAIDDIYKTY
ncbi:hypothetical protein KKF25_00685 [Patescibacteria group bacterium]|nr:hypothetical protein [Patescibacteria group bacterium]